MRTPLTPLVELPAPGNGNRIFAKCEYENPSGSHYDRLYARLLPELEREGVIRRGITTLVETTTGSAGIACTYYARAMNYPCIVFVPRVLPNERVNPMRELGAQIIYSFDYDKRYEDAQDKDEEEVRQILHAAAEEETKATGPEFLAFTVQKMQEFLHARTERVDGIRTYYCPNHSRVGIAPWAFGAIAVEALRQENAVFNCFIGAAGNGATLRGIGEVLRMANPATTLIGFEPAAAPVATSLMRRTQLDKTETHSLYGTGAVGVDFPHLTYAAAHLLNDVMTVQPPLLGKIPKEWEGASQELTELGFAVGRTSVAAYLCARRYCERFSHKNVLIIFYDRAERYPAL